MKWLGPTWIHVNLDALDHNLREVRRHTPGEICAVLKGDAYGHGAKVLSHFYTNRGVKYLAVNDLDEGLEIRESQSDIPILILSPVLPEQSDSVVRERLTATVSSPEIIRALGISGAKYRQKTKVHLKIDSGMGRIGIFPNQALEHIRLIQEYPFLQLEGIYTHFASAVRHLAYTRKQLETFLALKKELEGSFHGLIWHAANSAALVRLPESHLDMVRPGTILYGQSPVTLPGDWALQNTWTLYSRIIQVKKMDKGSAIGYGLTFTTKRPSTIAVIPVGYGDGLGVTPGKETHWEHIRNSLISILDNPQKVFIDNHPYPIVGKIAMGMCCIDVTDHPQPAKLYGYPVTIPTRRVTINRRIPKAYLKGGKVQLIVWQGKTWVPFTKNNQTYLKELPGRSSVASTILQGL